MGDSVLLCGIIILALVVFFFSPYEFGFDEEED